MQEDRVPNSATCAKILNALGLDQKNILENTLSPVAAKKRHKNLLTDAFDDKQFESIFESKHIYFLSALRSTSCTLDQIKSKLSKSCGIGEAEFKKITKELLGIGAIKATATGFELVYRHKSTVPLPFTTEKRKSLQKEFLLKAIQAIDEIAFEERENTTLTLSLNKKDWLQAKRILKEARLKINRLSEKKQPAETVYNICMAAYPVIKLS